MKQVFTFLLLFMLPVLIVGQTITDSTQHNRDSITPQLLQTYPNVIHRLLNDNIYLNTKGPAVALTVKESHHENTDLFFYCLLALVGALAFFRLFYTRYFNNLFRVFFNTSLRQSQLTDQLMQAKLPSLLFNLLFICSAGFYIYFLIRYFYVINHRDAYRLIAACIVGTAVIYFTKYTVLKFTGWLTGFKEVVNTYIFIVFLINKILGILLIPMVLILAFSNTFDFNLIILLNKNL